ncbi:TPA: glucose-6-phosphate isomerase, partial [Haemophilus influenzae]
ACVLVSDNGNTKNISTFSPRNPL